MGVQEEMASEVEVDKLDEKEVRVEKPVKTEVETKVKEQVKEKTEQQIREKVKEKKGTEEQANRDDATNRASATSYQTGLDVTEMLLPSDNSLPRTENVTHVMIHFTSNVVANPENPYEIQDTYDIFAEHGVSAHYAIDRNGNLYLFVAEDRMAYHAGTGSLSGFPEYTDRLNDYSIGVELLAIGTEEEMDEHLIGYTEAQYATLNHLLQDIDSRHPEMGLDRDFVIGHDEYASDRKSDLGSLFDWNGLEALREN